MLLLNQEKASKSTSEDEISIHLMMLLNWKYIQEGKDIDNFNTSHVVIKQISVPVPLPPNAISIHLMLLLNA